MTYGTITIPSGVTLTMEAGTVVKLSGINAKIQVDGTLNSNGTTEQPVHLTSLKDDSVWGDTNNDGTATSPAVGDWHMVCLNSDLTASTITNTRFCYGGNHGRSPCMFALSVQKGSHTISGCYFQDNFGGSGANHSGNSTIENSEFCGNNSLGDGNAIRVDAGNPTISGCHLHNTGKTGSTSAPAAPP